MVLLVVPSSCAMSEPTESEPLDEETLQCQKATHGKKPVAILPWLYIGNKEHAKNAPLLRSLGVKHILNCTPSREKDPNYGIANFFEQSGIKTPGAKLAAARGHSASASALPGVKYHRIPIYDNRSESVLPHVDAAVSFIDTARHHGAVFVHCLQGKSRSGSFILA